ncbi:ABC transporter substrate-binding protein [Ancylobacter mangrovi]|nr:ABC transporter substrate-binding protein [Ancylobacter mangrovi]MCS0502166.1 ABC transporter substrate-binding protein [Ancylobacter mangrovi]
MGGALALVAAAAVLACTLGPSPARAADQVRLALPWLVSGKNAAFFVGQAKGFYADEGLDVTISRGSGSGDTIKRIAAGESTFGLADSAAILAAQANDGSPVKIVAMMSGKSSVAILYVTESGIKTPADLKGRKIGRSAAGASVNMFPAFLKANNLDRTSFEEVVTAPATFLPLLLSRQVDAVLDQSSYLVRYRKGAAKEGLHIDAFGFGDYGVQVYGNALIASDELIKSNPDLIRRFVRASIKATEWSFAHMPEAVEILRKSNPQIETDVGEAELLDEKDSAMTPEEAKHGLGYVDADRMTQMQKDLVDLIGLKKVLPLDQIYTLDFLPKKS